MDERRLNELRSIEYHRASVLQLQERPLKLKMVFDRLEKDLTSDMYSKRVFAQRWLEALENCEGFDDLEALLTEDSERMQELRSSSPFIGIISQRTRLEIFREVAERHLLWNIDETTWQGILHKAKQPAR